jgi:TRAP-type C4-dicarboxylate transport system substrate-binding protein
MKRSLLAALAALAISGLAPAHAQEVTLRIHTFMPPVANPVKHFLLPWAEKIGKESNGRIKVQVFTAMQLGGNPAQLLQQVRDGVVDIIWTLPGFTPGVTVKDEVFELPFLHRSTRSTVLALQDFIEQHMQKELAPYHVLQVHAHAGTLFMTKSAVNTVEDLKGMRLRTPSRTAAWILEALGAAPVQVALPELAPMLSKGTVTGSLLTYEIAPAVKMQDLVDYFTTFHGPQPRLGTTVFMLLMNKQKYESLPADLKKVIDANSGAEWSAFAGRAFDATVGPNSKDATGRGNKMLVLSDAEYKRMQAAGESVNEEWMKEVAAKGGDGKALLKAAKDLLQKYAK